MINLCLKMLLYVYSITIIQIRSPYCRLQTPCNIIVHCIKVNKTSADDLSSPSTITEYFGDNKIISLIHIAAFYGLLKNSASFGERHPPPPV